VAASVNESVGNFRGFGRTEPQQLSRRARKYLKFLQDCAFWLSVCVSIFSIGVSNVSDIPNPNKFFERRWFMKKFLALPVMLISLGTFAGCEPTAADKQADAIRDTSQDQAEQTRDASQQAADQVRDASQDTAEKVRDAAGRDAFGSAATNAAERKADTIESEGEKKADAIESQGEKKADKIESEGEKKADKVEESPNPNAPIVPPATP
jgi:hypothetical protein